MVRSTCLQSSSSQADVHRRGLSGRRCRKPRSDPIPDAGDRRFRNPDRDLQDPVCSVSEVCPSGVDRGGCGTPTLPHRTAAIRQRTVGTGPAGICRAPTLPTSAVPEGAAFAGAAAPAVGIRPAAARLAPQCGATAPIGEIRPLVRALVLAIAVGIVDHRP